MSLSRNPGRAAAAVGARPKPPLVSGSSAQEAHHALQATTDRGGSGCRGFDRGRRQPRREPPRSTAHRGRSQRRHHRRLCVRELRRDEPRAAGGAAPGHVHHERHSRPEPRRRAELFQLRRRRDLPHQSRQRPRRQGGRRRVRVPLQDREPPGRRPGRPHLAGALSRQPGDSNERAAARHHQARRTGLRGAHPPPDLQRHRDPSRPSNAAVRRAHCGAVQRGSGDHAGLRGARGAGNLLGKLRRRHAGRARVRRPARRDLLHRPRRGLRYAEPAALAADSERRRRGRRQRQPVRESTASRAPTSTRSRSRCRSPA